MKPERKEVSDPVKVRDSLNGKERKDLDRRGIKDTRLSGGARKKIETVWRLEQNWYGSHNGVRFCCCFIILALCLIEAQWIEGAYADTLAYLIRILIAIVSCRLAWIAATNLQKALSTDPGVLFGHDAIYEAYQTPRSIARRLAVWTVITGLCLSSGLYPWAQIFTYVCLALVGSERILRGRIETKMETIDGRSSKKAFGYE